ncbi:MAG: DNA methyltransferase [Oceanicaulis sp.]
MTHSTAHESLSLKVEYVDPHTLIQYERHTRIHSNRQIYKIERSISRYGFVNPILIDDQNGVIAGHGRLVAALHLRYHEVPVIRLSHMSAAEKRAYIIADNRLAEEAGWDVELLRLELGDLIELKDEIDITDTGFDIAQVDMILLEPEGRPTGPDTDDVVPEEAPAVTRQGDLWLFDDERHRVLCGDALEQADVARLIDGQAVRMLLTDPPYNVPVKGHVSGLGKAEHGEFAYASGEMDAGQFTQFLKDTLSNGAAHLVDGGLAYVFMDWRHIEEVMAAGRAVFDRFENMCVWTKTNGGMGSLYRSSHELCFIFKSGKASHLNHVQLGRFGRNRTNVWAFAGANAFSKNRDADLADHPTVKPVGMLAEAMLDVTNPDDVVLDLFGGSGSTLLAARRVHRCACLMEYEPGYVDVMIRRWIGRYGSIPVLEETGESYHEVAARREAEAMEEA